MPTSFTAASAPPANMAVASPRLMREKASPSALVPAAQAVQVAFTGPLSPRRMELQAEAMLGIIMGMKKGLTRVGPLIEENADLLVEGVQTAHPGTDQRSDRVGIFIHRIAGVLQGQCGSGGPVLGVAIHPLGPSSCR